MHIVVTGSLGHISCPLVDRLLADRHRLTVITSRAARAGEIEAAGATPAIGSLDDAAFVAAAFEGADAAYCMVPPDFGQADQLAYYRRLGAVYAQALGAARVPSAVLLSSWGAHLSEGTGVILGTHHVENLLRPLAGTTALTFLRATSLYYNLLEFAPMIRAAGFIGSNYGGEDRVAWVHPRDIAEAAAEQLERPPVAGITIRYVASDELTAAESARIIGAAIGMPDLAWRTLPAPQVRQAMEQGGVPPAIAQALVELNDSVHTGRLGEHYWQNRPPLGRVKMADYAREFAAAFVASPAQS